MIKKKEKYKKQTEDLKKIFNKPTENTFLITIQLNSIKSSIIDQLKKYGEFMNIKVKFLNLKKIKPIFKPNQFFLKNINNEIILLKSDKGLEELKQVLIYLKELNIEKHLMIINILIGTKDYKFKELGELECLEKLQKYKKISKKEDIVYEHYKILKMKAIEVSLKLQQILRKKCQQ